MSMIGGLASQQDGGALITSLPGGASRSLGNAVSNITGTTIDRIPSTDEGPQQFDSFEMLVSYRAVLSANETWTVTLDFEDAPPSAADPDVAGTFANVPSANQPVTAAVEIDASGNGLLRFDGRLSDLERFIRFNLSFTPSLVNASEILEAQIVVNLLGPRKVVTRELDWTPNYVAQGL